jgi:2-aminoadipate transaminase
VDRGVAFVPGAAFYADHGDPRTLRLSFVTLRRSAVAILGRVLNDALNGSHAPTP